MRGGLVIAALLPAIAAVLSFGTWPVLADPPTASQVIADTGKPRSLTTNSPPSTIAPAAGTPADPDAKRAILDMPELAWQDLSREEATALKKLDWSKRSWDARSAPAAPWPRSMTTKFLNLTPVQKASVRKLGYKPLEWDIQVRKRLLSNR